MARWIWLWFCALVLVGAPALAQDDPAPPPDGETVPEAEEEAVLTDRRAPLVPRKGKLDLRVTPLGDGWVRPGTWTAVRVTLANGAPDQIVRLSVTETDSQTYETIPYLRRVEMPSGSVKEVDLYYRVSSAGGGSNVMVDPSASPPSRVPIKTTTVTEPHVLIGLIGEDPFGLQVVRETWSSAVPGSHPRIEHDDKRDVRVGTVPLDTLPERPAAWEAYDTVVWRQADPSKVQPSQLQALLRWVAAGGHLVITVSDTWQVVRSSALGEVLPVTLTGVVDGSIEPMVRGMQSYDHIPRTADLTASMPLAVGTLRSEPGRLAVALVDGADGPLWSVGTYGLGTVSLVSADPALAPFSDAVSREDLWRNLLFLPRPDWHGSSASRLGLSEQTANAVGLALRATTCGLGETCVYDTNVTNNMAWGGDDFTWQGQLRAVLSDVPGVAPLPLPVLVGFSLVYLLMIGPIDYFVLRWLKREPLTWITFPVTIALFTTIALVGTSLYKGNQAVLRRVEVVDLLPGTALARGQTFLGVFSTRKTDLAISAGTPDALVWPMETRGFMEEPRIGVSEGPGVLAYHTETWTLAYSTSRWVGEGPGSVYLTQEAGVEVLHIDLPFALENVTIRHGSGILARLGTLQPGEHRLDGVMFSGAGVNDVREITDVIAFPEEGRGFLSSAAAPVLYGVVRAPVQPISIEGLAPESEAITLIRAPLAVPGRFERLDAEPLWISTTLDLGGL